jgi:hypothetical protein
MIIIIIFTYFHHRPASVPLERTPLTQHLTTHIQQLHTMGLQISIYRTLAPEHKETHYLSTRRPIMARMPVNGQAENEDSYVSHLLQRMSPAHVFHRQ